MPRAFSWHSRPRLKSGASMPMNTSGGAARSRRTNSLRMVSSSGRWPITSVSPITASFSAGNSASLPAAIMRGPAMPKNSAVGKCCLSALMRPAPSRSPESSPATSAIRMVMNSAQDAAAGLFQEADHLLHLRCRLREFAHLRECILQGEIAAVKKLVGAAQLGNDLGAETAAAQALDVEAVRRSRMARHHHERRHILGAAAAERGEAVLAETAELMYLAEAAKDHVILDHHMAGQRGIIGEDGVVADQAIVREVHVRHDPIVVADPGDAAALFGAAIEGAEFADDVAVADLEQSGFATVFLVLRHLAERRELENFIVAADARRAIDDDMRPHLGTGADDHIRADDGERPDVDIRRQLGLGVDDRARIDQTTISLRAHMRSALATTRPSTFTSPLNFQMPRTARVSRTSLIY